MDPADVTDSKSSPLGLRGCLLYGLLLVAWGAGVWSSIELYEREPGDASRLWVSGHFDRLRPLTEGAERVAYLSNWQSTIHTQRIYALQYALVPAAVTTAHDVEHAVNRLSAGDLVVIEADRWPAFTQLTTDLEAAAVVRGLHVTAMRLPIGLAVIRPVGN